MDVKKSLSKGFRKLFPKKSAKEYGWKDEVREWAVSFIFAAVVYFIILPVILGTSSPMVVVSSCSEKGYLDIGDVLVIQGAEIPSLKVPFVNASRLAFSPVISDNQINAVNVSGKVFYASDSNDIVIYRALPSQAQIIHRVLVAINVSGKYYLLTKGDANPIPDQFGFYNNQIIQCVTNNPGECISPAITQENLLGKKVLFKMPYLGHLKLFFCDITTLCDGHANMGTNYEYKLSC